MVVYVQYEFKKRQMKAANVYNLKSIKTQKSQMTHLLQNETWASPSEAIAGCILTIGYYGALLPGSQTALS